MSKISTLKEILTPEEAINHMLQGGKCKYAHKDYSIWYKDGRFTTKLDSNIGNFNNMVKDSNEC